MSATSSRSNLPVAVDPFVGRETALAELAGEIGAGKVYVVGAPGAGKTRTTIEAARRRKDDGDLDEVWFVDLVPVHSAEGIVRAVGDVTGLAIPPSQTVEEGLDHFAEVLAARGTTLIVLDNAEHCSEAAELAADRFVEAGVAVVITSRRLPDADGSTVVRLDRLDPDDARALFLERMSRYRPTHSPTDEELATIDRIAKRLDALPLALELAAARTQILDLDVLLDRLEDPGGKLASASALERAFASSWELLDDGARRLLEQCTMFHGSFEATAAEAIFADGEVDVLGTLQELRSNSLLDASEREGRLRLRLLESLADFVAPKAASVREEYQQQFCRYYADLAARWLPRLHRDDAVRARELLQLDFDNLLVAYRMAIEHHEFDSAGTLFETLAELMLSTGGYRALAALGEEYLEMCGDEAVAATSLVHLRVTTADGMLGRRESAAAHVDAARRIAEELQVAELACRAAYREGWLQWTSGDVDAGLDGMRSALDIARREGIEEWSARALYAEATLLESERRAPVHQLAEKFETAVRAAKRVENLSYEALAWSGLTSAWLNRGYPERAAESARRAVDLFDQLGDGVRLAKAELDAAEMELERGDSETARDYARSAIRRAKRLGISWVEVLATITLTKLAIDTEDVDAFDQCCARLDTLQPQVAQATFVATADLTRAIGEWMFRDASRALTRVNHARELLDLVFESVVEVLTQSLHVVLSLLVTGEFSDDELGQLYAAGEELDPSDWLRSVIQVATRFAELDGASPESVEEWYQCLLRISGGGPTVMARSFWVRHLLSRLADETPAFVTDAVRRAGEEPQTELLFFVPERQWLRPPDGEWTDLSTRSQLVQLLELLIEQGEDGARKEEIRDHLWPGEKLHPTSAKNRLHAAISMLRKTGVGVDYHGGKYRLDPTTSVAVLES